MPVTHDDIARAAALLRRGRLVAFPTETVYGLGADASSADAVRLLFRVKGRPAGHPVIVHISSVDGLADWAAAVPEPARRLTEACWPGPLTIVVPRAPRVRPEVTGGLDTVALRVPAQPVALALLREFGGGIAAPSANRFGKVSPTTADDVRVDLGGDVDLVLDGGPCGVGVESTIVDCSGAEPTILRLGGVPRERVAEIVGYDVALHTSGEVRAPGTLRSHYAPNARVVLVASDEELADRLDAERAAGARVGVIGTVAATRLDGTVRLLGTPSDAHDYARHLYRWLRDADVAGLDLVLAVVPEERGIGEAVADRLRRASTPNTDCARSAS